MLPRKHGDDMPTLTDHIASWEEECLLPDTQFVGQDKIATEAQPLESPEWEICLDALLQIWSDSSPIGDPKPSRSAIAAAIAWVAFLRKRFPSAPPTCIVPEPDGGIIVERRATLPNGHECMCELTFYNDESAERTDYVDGRVVQMSSIPYRRQWRNA